MEALLTSLPVPIVVAVVTALVTSILSSRRAREDRLAALRLETYRDLVLAGQRWENAFNEAATAQASNGDVRSALERWQSTNVDLDQRMKLLPLVARNRALSRIRADYALVSARVRSLNNEVEKNDFETWRVVMMQVMGDFTDGLVREARREIRRTGA